jgi:hypothetical protein
MKKILFILTFLIFTSCEDNRCIEANDFGQPKASVNVYGNDTEPRVKNAQG